MFVNLWAMDCIWWNQMHLHNMAMMPDSFIVSKKCWAKRYIFAANVQST